MYNFKRSHPQQHRESLQSAPTHITALIFTTNIKMQNTVHI